MNEYEDQRWGGGEQLPEGTESSESHVKQTKKESNFLCFFPSSVL